MFDKLTVLMLGAMLILFQLGSAYAGYIIGIQSRTEIIKEKHIPSYIDADCILQIMEDDNG